MANRIEPPVSVNDISRISTGTSVKGEISSPLDIRIDGTFDGKIYSKGRVVVGEKAVIKGDIICQNVDFWGTMNGNFYVKDTLTLKAGCNVNGDLNIKRLQVELDARFTGNCKMISDAEFDRLSSRLTEPQSSEKSSEKPSEKAAASKSAAKTPATAPAAAASAK